MATLSNKGEYITAAYLNGKLGRLEKKTDSTGWQPDFRWYSHRAAGSLLCELEINCGWFGGICLRVAKTDAAGNTLNMILSEDHGWSTHVTDTCYSLGPGWYRVWATEGSQIDGKDNWYLYYNQDNCQKGGYLTLYDNPESSGNRLTGTFLTLQNLWSGRAGTI